MRQTIALTLTTAQCARVPPPILCVAIATRAVREGERANLLPHRKRPEDLTSKRRERWRQIKKSSCAWARYAPPFDVHPLPCGKLSDYVWKDLIELDDASVCVVWCYLMHFVPDGDRIVLNQVFHEN